MLIEDVEPVSVGSKLAVVTSGRARTELTTTEDDDVSRFGVGSGLHLTTVFCWDTHGTEELLVLVHVERYAADGVRI